MTHRLSDEDIATFAVLLAAAGSETVTKLVGNGVMAFHRNPDQWELVLADPDTDPRRDRGDAAAQPALAVSGPIRHPRGHARTAARFPAGSPTLLVTGAATRDPRAYDRPDVFDIRRGGATTLAFGYGAHSCLGSWLARLETRVAFAAPAATWPRFEVDTDGLRRVTMSNVAGYSHIPVHVG